MTRTNSTRRWMISRGRAVVTEYGRIQSAVLALRLTERRPGTAGAARSRTGERETGASVRVGRMATDIGRMRGRRRYHREVAPRRDDLAGSGVSFHDFEISEQQEDDAVRLSLHGELDLASAPMFEERLSRLAGEGHAVQLDLSELEFMDGAGIHALAQALSAARSNDWRFEVLPNLGPQVRRVLSLAHVDRMISGEQNNGR